MCLYTFGFFFHIFAVKICFYTKYCTRQYPKIPQTNLMLFNNLYNVLSCNQICWNFYLKVKLFISCISFMSSCNVRWQGTFSWVATLQYFTFSLQKLLSIYNITSYMQEAENWLKIGYKMVCWLKVSFEVMNTPVIFFHFVALATTRSDIHRFTFRMSVSHSVTPYIHNSVESNVIIRFSS